MAAGKPLSKRLKMNADLVPRGCRLADIGCDHGYVSIYLAERDICPGVIATDVKSGPLRIAGRNVAAAGLSARIECRRSDGLAGLRPGEVDALLIAGMGGMTLCRILEGFPDVMARIHTLVLQPQSDLYAVRKTLYELGFHIDRESFCVDAGKDYLAIRALRVARGTGDPGHTGTGYTGAEYTETEYTEAEYEYGRFLPEEGDREYREYLLRERDKMKNILDRLQKKETAAARARTEDLLHILNRVEDRLEIYEKGGTK